MQKTKVKQTKSQKRLWYTLSMMRGGRAQGYTLVEVMIFLAISSLLFVSATVTINGQQARTQFTQSMRDADSMIHRVINDVYSGFYPSYNNTRCFVPGASGNLQFSGAGPDAGSQGTNDECVFLGKAIQFGVTDPPTAADRNGLYIYSIAGRRLISSTPAPGIPVTDFAQAVPTAVVRPGVIDLTEQTLLKWGLEVRRVGLYIPGTPGSVGTDVSAVGFVTSFNQFNSGTTDLVSGSQTLDLMAATGNGVGQGRNVGIDAVPLLSASTAPNGVVVCFFSQNTQQRAAIIIGSENRDLSTRLALDEGSIPDGCPTS